MISRLFRVKHSIGILVFFLILLALAGAARLHAAEEARVLRFPAIYKDLVVFSYAGDLYSVPAAGGVARRLTSHVGYEAFARFSPDGKFIAFTGEYDGNREVFLMPAEGGVPVRLTYTPVLGRDDISDRMGPNNIVMGWTPDGQKIIFRSRMAEWNDFNGQLYLVPRDGGTPEELPLPRGGFCSFSPDGQKLAFNRIFREFRTWKRYRGGMVDDIWVYDFKTKKTENITNNGASDIIPMWSGNRIYFLSDRDENKRFNLYVYNTETGETRKVTDFKDYDIKFPSLGPDSIVFENGGYLYKLDLASEKVSRIPVHIADDQVVARTELVKVADRVNTWDIAPDGARAVFGARGEIFTVPAKNGNTRNLTGTPGVHERDVAWSPDGRWIAFISDKTGREEVYIIPQDGSGPAVQLTSDGECYKYAPLWSPDGKKLLWSDRMFRLRYVDVEKKQVVEVARSKFWEINDYTWSPDSAWIAFSDQAENGMQKVYIHNLNSKETVEITDSWYSSYSPCFSADGKYLFFVSDRDFSPVYSRTEWNHAYLNMSRIYLVTLTREVKSPFEPKSDEVKVAAAEATAPEKPKIEKPVAAKPAAEKLAVRVDKEGIKDRIVALPVEVSGYFGLTSVGDKLFYMKRSFGDRQTSLKFYDLGKLEEKDLGSVNGYVISADKKKMLVQQGRDFAIIDLPAGPIKIEDKLNLSELEMWLDRKAEWAQIFDECWRQMKDFFYAPNMHGVDWEKVRAQYEPLARAVNHRADLTYVIGEMIGELNAGHTYVGGGDLPKVDRVNVGRLGARLERDRSGYYLIKKILAGQNWDRSLRSPLTEVGVNVKEGEYIIAVNGKPVNQVKDIYELLVNTAGKQVTLKVNSQPSDRGAREVVVVPIETENSLYYYNWVKKNTEYVAKATGGKVAYIHVPDMGVTGLNEFVKHFYPQVDKKALIIDVRGNGGGNVSPMLIERLARQAVMMDIARGSVPRPDPEALIMGPKVCLINEFSASDGDIFPYRFKRMQLGKLIGKRTWGGVVGIRGTLPLVDGGYLNKPEFATFSLEGQWIIEGEGVEPDIYVDNDPAKEYEGIDEQLNKAIELILEELKTREPKLPAVPPYPKK
ncbi:MAG: tolB protein [Candidatus Saccharicenans subterraneus]|uniref:Tricorn protease homolog n=1 Tax=Candidatus Saccharicenans subterraneus TaxID=2508984 RepID=A0A3E2BJD2_9BACT|nr:MAG: tolB protein [Candidatus Saccharicenans subterraneum]